MPGGRFIAWRETSSQLGFYPPSETGIFLDGYIKRYVPGAPKKDIHYCKTSTRHFKRFTSQRARERIYSYKFSKISDLSKKKTETCGIKPPAFCKSEGGR